MITTLRPGEKPAFPQVRVHEPRLTEFLAALFMHAPPLVQALMKRPTILASLHDQKDGLRTQLTQIRDAANAALADLDPRPATDPLPPTPRPVPVLSTHH